jgi:hypothetical protein
MLLALTGKRYVGKSTIADVLVAEYGFTKLHAFGAGKVMVVAYYQHLGIDPETAYRLVYGDLKDTPHPLIPGDGLSRTFMEKLGYHMGVDMGCEYTLGAEYRRAKTLNPEARFIIESMVYEAPYFKKLGGILIRVTRESAFSVQGIHTDAAVAAIPHDVLFNNIGPKSELDIALHGLLHDPVIYDHDWSKCGQV